MNKKSKNTIQPNQRLIDENLFKRIPVSLFNDPIWITEQAFSRKEAYIDLYALAFDSHQNDSEVIPINDSLVRIFSGQVARGLRTLAIRWNWSTKKVNGFLQKLDDYGYIKIVMRHPVTVIELKNYVHRIFSKRNMKETQPLQEVDAVAAE